MNIELIFCQLSGKPRLVLKPTKRGLPVLEWVVTKSEFIPPSDMVKINSWEVDENRRVMMRVLTGNVLSAYGVAKNIIENDDNFSKTLDFLKFTTVDNSSIRVGVRLHMNPPFRELRPDSVPVLYSINNPDYVENMNKVKDQYTVYTRNGMENFMVNFKANSWVQVCILGGKRGGSKSLKNKYTSKLYLGENRDKINAYFQDKGISYSNNLIRFTPVGAQKSVTCDYVGVNLSLKEEDKNQVKDLLSFLHTLEPISMSLKGVEMEETIYAKEDLFVPDRIEESEVGDYGYDSLGYMYNELSKLKEISSFDRYVETSKFGSAYFKMRLSPRQAINYNLIPLNNNVMQMVKDTFSLISNDSEKINFTQQIEKAVKEGKSDFELGAMVQNVLKGKVLNFKTIFGYNGTGLTFLGEVFRKYVNGEIEIPKQERQEDEAGQEEDKIIRPLDFDTAQDYLILLKYKLK